VRKEGGECERGETERDLVPDWLILLSGLQAGNSGTGASPVPLLPQRRLSSGFNAFCKSLDLECAPKAWSLAGDIIRRWWKLWEVRPNWRK
jgi:hypothetical protein